MFPTALFVITAGTYIALSGAPWRVHLLSLCCLAVGFWVPATLAGDLRGLRRYWLACLGLGLSSVLLWDVLAPLVVLKLDPFFIALENPWLYGVSGIILLCLVTVNSLLVSAASIKHSIVRS